MTEIVLEKVTCKECGSPAVVHGTDVNVLDRTFYVWLTCKCKPGCLYPIGGKVDYRRLKKWFDLGEGGKS